MTPQLAEADGGALTVEHRTLYEHVSQGVKNHPQNTAIVCMHQPSDHLGHLIQPHTAHVARQYLVWTYRDLNTAAQRVALGLQARGVRRGSTIATLIQNGVEWAILRNAAVLLDLTFVPLDHGMVTSARQEELTNLMKVLEPAAVVAMDLEAANAVDRGLSAAGVESNVRALLNWQGDNVTDGPWILFGRLGIGMATESEDVSRLLAQAQMSDPEHVTHIFFTSGTSVGKPKGCPARVRQVLPSLTVHREEQAMTENSRFLLITQNFRVISTLALAAWSAGAAVIVPSVAFTPKGTLDAIEHEHATTMVLVPALFHALTDDATFPARTVSSVKLVFIGADIVSRDLFAKVERAFPQARVQAGHGMSEGGGIFTWPFSRHGAEDIPFFKDLAPLGIVERGSKVRIVDDQTKATARRGEPGELHICSINIIDRYLGGIQKDAFWRDAGSTWFNTGDLALMNDDGVVYILGRVKDRIKRAGIPIMPAALESCIDNFTDSRTAVVGVPHATLGQEPFAVVQTLGGRSRAAVKQHVVEVFGKDFALGGVLELQELRLDGFPLNATGKVMKIILQEKVAQSVRDRSASSL